MIGEENSAPCSEGVSWYGILFALQGEFCTGVGVGTLSRERFVPGLVPREEGGTKCVSSLPDWRPGTACEIGGEVSDQLLRGSWASSRRSWADLHRGSTRIRIGSASIR